ncbi:GNAT family N-acetyltransferase [Methylobacterium sp. NEAU 140]|uniref:GNAT family N-acetyltransferase n=1 Tax=Methylobacterium sp. NEAU 140 TaxID=3064945 RepID=UPI0027332962|nr:GNAT family N-acetyltransferase [Methylobacterium sp. NEAU 140]MDP4022318.1 GNAT family N-acetyltransferase [Methylobacterium sp. NEAU 140]
MASIFEQPWWIGAATDGAVRQIAFADGASCRAHLTVVPHRAWGLRRLAMPRLARVWSPQITFGSVRPKNPLPAQVRALQGLVAQLPAHDDLAYTLPPESDLVLAHGLAGFAVTPTYTFRSVPCRDGMADDGMASDGMAGMDQKIRYNIRSGLKRVAAVEHGDIERYIGLSRAFIRSRAFRNSYDYDALRRIFRAAHERGQGTVLSAHDRQGRDVASAVLLLDERSVYYWLNCRDPEAGDYVANSVLIWEAMRYAAARNLQFDMDGYHTPEAGVFLSRFGLTPVPRYAVSRASPRYAMLSAQYDLAKSLLSPEMRGRLLGARGLLAKVRAARIR